MHHETPDLRRPVVAVARSQHAVDVVPIQGRAVLLLLAYLEIDVRHAAPAELRDDGRGADRALTRAIPEHEHVFALARVANFAVEAALRGLEEAANRARVIRQVDRVQVPRE